MSYRKDAVEMARTDTIDLIRTLLRYKYRVLMRAELNEVESVLVDKFDESVTIGAPFALDAKDVLEAIQDED